MTQFRPLSTSNSQATNYGAVNDMVRQLNHEQVTKAFKQPGGNAILEGKLPYDGGYGSLYYDSTNTPRALIGIAPTGDFAFVITKTGHSVLDVFS